jgi:hypothetical protein
VSLQGNGTILETAMPPHDRSDDYPAADERFVHHVLETQVKQGSVTSTLATAIVDDERRRRVFITHGKNRDLVEPIKKLLEYGEMVPVVSVERQSVSKPAPEKMMADMRLCSAAMIHVDADKTITDTGGDNHVLLNPNLLIEIGAAMAF